MRKGSCSRQRCNNRPCVQYYLLLRVVFGGRVADGGDVGFCRAVVASADRSGDGMDFRASWRVGETGAANANAVGEEVEAVARKLRPHEVFGGVRQRLRLRVYQRKRFVPVDASLWCHSQRGLYFPSIHHSQVKSGNRVWFEPILGKSVGNKALRRSY